MVEAPYRFAEAKSGVQGPAPHRGEHNAAVLRDWIALPADEIADLERAGVLLSAS